MLVIGLIGGTGWPATRDYYELINRLTQERLGGLHGADLRLWSFDFQKLMDVVEQPGAVDAYFSEAAVSLNKSGAQLLAVASNTGHLFLSSIEQAGLPLVHIGHACAQALAACKVKRVGILATRRACTGGVFNTHFQSAGIEVCYLDPACAELLDQAIFNELQHGKPGPLTRQAFLQASKAFLQQGIEDILLGCTELRLALLPPELLGHYVEGQPGLHPSLHYWDSTDIHCNAIVGMALSSAAPRLSR